MSVEIHQPEIEALIEQRMASGGFHTVEDVLLFALKTAPVSPESKTEEDLPKQNLADFLLESPLAGSGLKLERLGDCPRPVEL
jgi:hypothetical protein